MIAISSQPEQYSTHLLDYKTAFPITGVKTTVLAKFPCGKASIRNPNQNKRQ